MKSIFTDKNSTPTNEDLANGLGDTFLFWQELEAFAMEKYPAAIGAWHFSGDKFGWSFRISDKKRVLVYLLPRDRYFKVAFVFGQKATDKVLEGPISNTIKETLLSAKAYAEGRGIRIDIYDSLNISDVKELISIKIAS